MNNNYLVHYGIKGQKWGVRRFQNEDGTLTEEGKQHLGYDSNGQLKNRMSKKELRKKEKERKKNEIRSLVKNYQKEMNKASNMTDEADAQWEKVKKERKTLGKTKLSRTINAAKGKSKEAKAYSKEYNKASDMSDKAYEQELKAKELYKKIGKTKMSRVYRNIKYG